MDRSIPLILFHDGGGGGGWLVGWFVDDDGDDRFSAHPNHARTLIYTHTHIKPRDSGRVCLTKHFNLKGPNIIHTYS